MVIPKEKESILHSREIEAEKIKKDFHHGLLTDEERDREIEYLWNRKNEEINTAVDKSMRETNPLGMIVKSGARGKKYHLHKMVGMCGYSKDILGKTINLPAKNSLREGLSPLDFFNASHNARNGIINQSLHTPEAGYLTRRLIDAAQDVIVCEEDCDVETLDFDKEQIIFASRPEVKQTIMGLKQILVGSMLYEDITDRRNGNILLHEGDTLDADDITLINHHLVETITVITPTNEAPQMFNLNTIDAIEEYNRVVQHRLTVHFAGKKLEDDVLDRQGDIVFTAGTIITPAVANIILDADIPVIRVRMNQAEGIEISRMEDNGKIIESLAERIAGRCPLEDVVNPITGEIIVTKNKEINDNQAEEIQKYYDKLKVRSLLTCHSAHGVCAKCYGRDLARHHQVEVGEAVGIIAAQSIGEPGTQLILNSLHPEDNTFATNFVKGIERIEELFEAKKPKNCAIISRFAGKVVIDTVKEDPNVKIIVVFPENSFDEPQYEKILPQMQITVKNGEFITAGTKLIDGNIYPNDIMDILGVPAAQKYILTEMQKEYHSHGIEINDKHFEVIIHQMCRKIKISEPGDSDWLPGERINIDVFNRTNECFKEEKREKVQGEHLLLGITKAALATDSFLSAASFQETSHVLTERSIKGEADPLLGLKENIIISKLIPAGTGYKKYQKLHVHSKVKDAPQVDTESKDWNLEQTGCDNWLDDEIDSIIREATKNKV